VFGTQVARATFFDGLSKDSLMSPDALQDLPDLSEILGPEYVG
jgi:hypothetical protein